VHGAPDRPCADEDIGFIKVIVCGRACATRYEWSYVGNGAAARQGKARGPKRQPQPEKELAFSDDDGDDKDSKDGEESEDRSSGATAASAAPRAAPALALWGAATGMRADLGHLRPATALEFRVRTRCFSRLWALRERGRG
jgi:hypothetical protein